MNINELRDVFLKEKIPTGAYSLDGGEPNESYCIEKKLDAWEVYYSERGSRSDLKIFDTEDEACRHLYKRVKRMF